MDEISKPARRRVIPNWRYYTDTLQLGEQETYLLNQNKIDIYPIDDYINDWIDKKSVYRASDLISAAICNGQKNNPHVVEAAKYILDSQHKQPTKLQQTAAQYIFKGDSAHNKNSIKIKDARDKLTNFQDVREKIHGLRIMAHLYPYNPVLYVDMARAYTIVGQMVKAENMIRIALSLDPQSRFVARSAARFFIHKGDIDRAAEIIRKTKYAKKDSWLMASEVSIGMLRNKYVSSIKLGEQIIFSDNYDSFAITELASSLGTIELESGFLKKSRKIFNRSLVAPNDNSLAQAEWALCYFNNPLIFNEKDVPCDYETRTFRNLVSGNYKEALVNAINWVYDMPFSTTSVGKAYDISTMYVKDYKLSSQILEVGLKAHPNNKNMLNNRAYVNALANDIEEAKKDMMKLESICSINEGGSIPICMTATQGLIAYREKNLEEGRAKYDMAIKMAQELNDEELVAKAKLNKIREEIIASNYDAADIFTQLDAIQPSHFNESLLILKADILQLLEANRS